MWIDHLALAIGKDSHEVVYAGAHCVVYRNPYGRPTVDQRVPWRIDSHNSPRYAKILREKSCKAFRKLHLVTTEILIKAGELQNVKLLDHIIVSSDGWCSLRESYPAMWLAASADKSSP
jgi:hypothetical protein